MLYNMCVCVCVFVVKSLSHVQLFATPWTAAHQASLSFTVSWSLLKLMYAESMMQYSQNCSSTTAVDFRTFLSPQKEILCLLGVIPYFIRSKLLNLGQY